MFITQGAELDLAGLLDGLFSSELVGPAGAAEILDAPETDVLAWARDGILPCESVEGQVIFRVCDLVRWLAEGTVRLSRTSAPLPPTLLCQ